MPDPVEIFDRELLLRRRARAAPTIQLHEFLLQRAADDMIDRLGIIKRHFPVAAALSAYHGIFGRMLRASGRAALVIDVEPCLPLLAHCGVPRLAAGEDWLPFAPASLDLVVSTMGLQFVNDLPGALAQIRAALKPDGLFLAAMLGGRTLFELREAMLAAETECDAGASPRVAPFADVRELGALLGRAGFALPVADSDVVTAGYPDALALMRDLRGMGAGNALLARRRAPLRRGTLLRAAEIYAERFARQDDRIRATFEIVTLTGWAPDASQPKPLQPGSARMRLADALGTREHNTGVTAPAPPRKPGD